MPNLWLDRMSVLLGEVLGKLKELVILSVWELLLAQDLGPAMEYSMGMGSIHDRDSRSNRPHNYLGPWQDLVVPTAL